MTSNFEKENVFIVDQKSNNLEKQSIPLEELCEDGSVRITSYVDEVMEDYSSCIHESIRDYSRKTNFGQAPKISFDSSKRPNIVFQEVESETRQGILSSIASKCKRAMAYTTNLIRKNPGKVAKTVILTAAVCTAAPTIIITTSNVVYTVGPYIPTLWTIYKIWRAVPARRALGIAGTTFITIWKFTRRI